MTMKEDLLKVFIAMMGAPRVRETIISEKSDLSDGVLFHMGKLDGLLKGAYRSVDILRIGKLACSCPAVIRSPTAPNTFIINPSVSCGCHDEKIFGEHKVCLRHAKRCLRCAIFLCPYHQPPPMDPPSPIHCPTCANKTGIDLRINTIFDGIGRLLK